MVRFKRMNNTKLNAVRFFLFLFQRYRGAHILLHALQYQTQNPEEKNSLTKYKDAVEKRLQILEEQGYVHAYETMNHWRNKEEQQTR